MQLIDLFGHDADTVRRRWPATFQHVLVNVKPEREAKAHTKDGAGYARLWWLHGKPRQELRKMLVGLPRYIATVETAKHRVFQFLDAAIAPDNRLICIALDDGYSLGVLSSRVHVCWALAQGGTLEDRPVYNKTSCFDTFPFPAASTEQQARVGDLAEQIDAHRKRVLAAHESPTLTGLYNVLAKVSRGDTPLNAKEKTIHDQGLVAVLKSLHDELDAAVLDAYGWHDTPTDEQILERLVALNAERAAEEAQGNIRWLRPAFQNPQGGGERSATPRNSVLFAANEAATTQPEPPTPLAPKDKTPWPSTLPDQMAALAAALDGSPQLPEELAARFAGKGKWKARLPELLATLATLGRARSLEDGRWMR